METDVYSHCAVIQDKPESHFGLCFWLDLAAKWLKSHTKSQT